MAETRTSIDLREDDDRCGPCRTTRVGRRRICGLKDRSDGNEEEDREGVAERNYLLPRLARLLSGELR